MSAFKFLAVLFIFSFSLATWAQSLRIECTYKYADIVTERGRSSGWQTHRVEADTTVATVSDGINSYTLYHDIDFDIVTYAKKQMFEHNISNGFFFGFRRDEYRGILILATAGKITNGVITDVKTDSWNMENMSEITAGEISCKRVVDPQ